MEKVDENDLKLNEKVNEESWSMIWKSLGFDLRWNGI
jgi:hypothetical protein